MTDITIGDKQYSLGFTMLSVVRAKTLTGKPFFSIAAQEEASAIDPEAAIQKVLDLLLIGLQTNHADEFKSVDDVARAFPDMNSIMSVTPIINAELTRFLTVDESLQKRFADAQASKKKSRSTRSPKTDSSPNVE